MGIITFHYGDRKGWWKSHRYNSHIVAGSYGYCGDNKKGGLLYLGCAGDYLGSVFDVKREVMFIFKSASETIYLGVIKVHNLD